MAGGPDEFSSDESLVGDWHVLAGRWPVLVGMWPVLVGGWPVLVGRWPVLVGWALYAGGRLACDRVVAKISCAGNDGAGEL